MHVGLTGLLGAGTTRCCRCHTSWSSSCSSGCSSAWTRSWCAPYALTSLASEHLHGRPPSAPRCTCLTRQRSLFSCLHYAACLWALHLYCACFLQAVFTVLPVRFARAALAALRCVAGERPGRRPRAGGLAADQLFDVLCVLIFGAMFGVLRLLPAGAIYFWLKDLTQEFLKLHVVHSAVEIFDKARAPEPLVSSCCNLLKHCLQAFFGQAANMHLMHLLTDRRPHMQIACTFVVDSLEALSGSCVIFVTGHGSRCAPFRSTPLPLCPSTAHEIGCGHVCCEHMIW